MARIVSNIVFSKNRPLQLDAYLRSLYTYFPAELIRTYIIYKQELFAEQYESLFGGYPDCVVVREDDFHSDFLKLLSEVDTEYILFGIDDVVFFDSVDFGLMDETFRQCRRDTFGFTLRFGPETLKDTGDTVTQVTIEGRDVYRLDWTRGRTPRTRYPFELCATFYRTALVKKIIGNAMSSSPVAKRLFSPTSALIRLLGKSKLRRRILRRFGYFYAPNPLESWNCRWCQNNSRDLPAFILFQRQCAASLEVNMVSTSTRSEDEGPPELCVEELAEKYKQGYRLDIGYIAKNKPATTHCGRDFFHLIKV